MNDLEKIEESLASKIIKSISNFFLPLFQMITSISQISFSSKEKILEDKIIKSIKNDHWEVRRGPRFAEHHFFLERNNMVISISRHPTGNLCFSISFFGKEIGSQINKRNIEKAASRYLSNKFKDNRDELINKALKEFN